MGTQSLDQDLLSTMTAQERAALDDADESQIAALRAVAEGAAAGGDDDDDDDDAPRDPALDDDGDAAAQPAGDAAAPAAAPAPTADAAGAAAPAPAAADAAAAAAQQPAAADAKPADGAKPEPAAAPAPQQVAAFEFELPADYDARVQALKDNRSDLRKQLDAGDISLDEYTVKLDELADEARALDKLAVKAEVSESMRRQVIVAENERIANAVMASAKEIGLDYGSDEAAFAELKANLDALQNAPAAKKGFAHCIAMADRMVRLDRGLPLEAPKATAPAASAPAPAPVAPKDVKAAAAAARTPDVATLPKSLAGVAGGDGPGDAGGDEFEDMDSLSGFELEDAIAARARANPRFIDRFTRGTRH